MNEIEKVPFIELPVQWQSANIDIESIAPLRNFNPEESYDVANLTAVICLNVPQEQYYRLVLPCDVESGTHAFARTVSSIDDKLDAAVKFVRITKKEAVDYIPLVDKSGLFQEGYQQEQKIDYITKHFKHAVIKISAGQQVLRIHASQKLLPVNGDPRRYSLVAYAPLMGFIIAGGQTNLSLVVTMPPAFAGNMVYDGKVVDPLPGQPTPPEAVPSFEGMAAASRVFAWHWRNDPRVTINYHY